MGNHPQKQNQPNTSNQSTNKHAKQPQTTTKKHVKTIPTKNTPPLPPKKSKLQNSPFPFSEAQPDVGRCHGAPPREVSGTSEPVEHPRHVARLSALTSVGYWIVFFFFFNVFSHFRSYLGCSWGLESTLCAGQRSKAWIGSSKVHPA